MSLLLKAVSEEENKLIIERGDLLTEIEKANERVKEINSTLRKLETQKKKFEATLGESQKGITE